MTNFILGVFEITIGISLFIALLILGLKIFGGKFTAKCRYIIWALVMLRLALPFSFGILPTFIEIPIETTLVESEDVSPAPSENTAQITQGQPSDSGDTIVNPTVPGTSTVPTVPKVPSGDPDVDHGNTPTLPSDQAEPTIPSEPIIKTPTGHPISLKQILDFVGIVYLAGAAVFFIWNLLSYVIYTRKILRSAKAADKHAQQIFSSICKKYGVTNQPTLLVASDILSPAAFGIFRRRIVLPDIAFTENGLVGTLAHEVTHCKRGDLYVKLVELIACSLNWFNPLVHIAAFKCEMEMELSCDEKVLSGSNDAAREAYADVMLDIIRRCRRSRGALTTHFNPKKGAITARFKNILYGSGKRRGRILISVCLVLCILAGTFVACRTGDALSDGSNYDESNKHTSENNSDQSPQVEETDASNGESTGTIPEETTKDVTEILEDDWVKHTFHLINDSALISVIVPPNWERGVDNAFSETFVDEYVTKDSKRLEIIKLQGTTVEQWTEWHADDEGPLNGVTAEGCEYIGYYCDPQIEKDVHWRVYYFLVVSEDGSLYSVSIYHNLDTDHENYLETVVIPTIESLIVDMAQSTRITQYTVDVPLEDDRDYITVAGVYGKGTEANYPDGNIIHAGKDGTLYYVMGVGNEWWSAGNFKSLHTYRVTSKEGYIESVEEVETFTKNKVLANGKPYTGALDGMFTCLTYRFIQGNFNYDFWCHSIFINGDGTIYARAGMVGTGGPISYEGTYQYDEKTGDFTAKLTGRYESNGEVHLYPESEVKGKLYEYGGFVHFVCESSGVSTLTVKDPIPLTFVPNTDGYADPPTVVLDDTFDGVWEYNDTDKGGKDHYRLSINTQTAQIQLDDMTSGSSYVGTYTVNPLTMTTTAKLRSFDSSKNKSEFTLTFTLGYTRETMGTFLYFDVISCDDSDYQYLAGKMFAMQQVSSDSFNNTITDTENTN